MFGSFLRKDNMRLLLLIGALLGPAMTAPNPNIKSEARKPNTEAVSEVENQLDQLRQPKGPAQENPGTPVRPRQRVGSLKQFNGIQYSPADLAEYIIRTGDEEGVALAVEELFKEGMIDRNEAVDYLHDVKDFMTYLQDITKEVSPGRSDLPPPIKLKRPADQPSSKSEPSTKKPEVEERTTAIPSPSTTTGAPKSTETTPQASQTTAAATNQSQEAAEEVKRGQNLLRVPLMPSESRLREELRPVQEMGDKSLYQEYTLEEIIYQLARNMFEQSLAQGDPTAENSLNKLVSFMEAEVVRKKISPEMKERILELMSTALVDTLREYPGMIAEERLQQYQRPALLPRQFIPAPRQEPTVPLVNNKVKFMKKKSA